MSRSRETSRDQEIRSRAKDWESARRDANDHTLSRDERRAAARAADDQKTELVRLFGGKSRR